MAFNPANYQVSTKERCMSVVLLLDVSYSMDGEKIDRLYDAVTEMLGTFVAHTRSDEMPYKVAIITFGQTVDCHTRYTDAKLLSNLPRFYANGSTPLGTALRMAKGMIEDREETPTRWYGPTTILVSDGCPNDSGWEVAMHDFINNGRTSRRQRISVAIGNDADEGMLKSFASNAELFFKADDASKIADAFEKVTQSVEAERRHLTNSGPASMPKKPQTSSEPAPRISRRDTVKKKLEDDDDDWN